MIVLWLLLLSITSYVVIQKSASAITRTPVWLLWLVMMSPLLLWMGWMMVVGDRVPLPLPLWLGVFIACPVVYWILIQVGRRPQDPSAASLSAENTGNNDTEAIQSESRPLTAGASDGQPEQEGTMDRDEEDALKRCFPWTVYYLKGIEHRAQALICTGQLRTSSEVAYNTIRTNIESTFGQRFLIIFQEGLNGKPFFALVPNNQAQFQVTSQQLFRPVVAGVLGLATVYTTTLAGMMLAGIPEEEVFTGGSTMLWQGLPYCVAIMTILMVYHFSQYFMARRYQLKVSLPYFIPIPPVILSFPFGTFGALLQVRSPMPNRKVLFDMGFIGPVLSILATLPFLGWGLAHSELIARIPEAGLFNPDAFDPRSSFLVAVLSKIALSGITADQVIDLHPVAIAGCLGLLIATINLMPVGQLNGGKIVHAMFGQRTGAVIGQLARLLVVLLAYIHYVRLDQQGFWILPILLFFMPSVDEPALNDVSELDNRRDYLGIAALALLVIIILPSPPALAPILF